MFERLPSVFSHLESLSLSLVNATDLYLLVTLILSKVALVLKKMTLSIESYFHENQILNEFMSWLISYMHSRDLEKVDVKHIDSHVYFCF
jgi:hypothetical protein